MIALTELAPALSAFSAPRAHSSSPTQEFHSGSTSGDTGITRIGVTTDVMNGEHQVRYDALLDVAQLYVQSPNKHRLLKFGKLQKTIKHLG